MTLPVVKTPTATHVTASLNPALPTEEVTFTATVAVPDGNAAYDGTVQFAVDGDPLGAPQPAVAGVATSPPFEPIAVGAHRVTAVAAETADYAGSEGGLVETVDPDGTAVHVTSSRNPAEYGSPLQLEAEVSPRPPVTLTPTGSVSFLAADEQCASPLEDGAGACSLPAPLSPGAHEVEAEYGGTPISNRAPGG